jgi:thioredoxin 1
MAEHTTETTDETFQTEVLEATTPVLVDFWAPWCGPCRLLAPTIDQLASEAVGKVKVVKHNTQDHDEIPTKYDVSAIPTLMVFQGGKVVHRLIGGGRTVDDLKRVLNEHAGVDL